MDRMRVAIVRCKDYGPSVQQAVDRIFSDMGGIERFAGRGKTVLIKPNLLSDRDPAQAVTTHPEVVRAVIRTVKSAGAVPLVGDSPASVMKIEKVWTRTGISEVCKTEGVELLNFEKCGSVEAAIGGVTLSFARPALECDALINVPKLKTHVLTVLTNAVKNLYGVLPGFQKTRLHQVNAPLRDFSRMLADICRKLRPAFSIADAVLAMHGNGPSGGQPVNLGFLAGSADPFALDVAMCGLLKIEIESVPYLDDSPAPESIEWAGDPADALRLPDFKLPSPLPAMLYPSWLLRLLAPILWIRPFVDNTRCTGCGLCARSCPVNALRMENNRPVLSGRLCVACCCCHEVCPESAVEMRQSRLLRLAAGSRMLSK